ncbi:MAG: hypothetical protein ABI479_10745 [Gallionella sp.]
MKTTMDMSSYEIEQDAIEIEQYDEEILSAGWNPAVELVCEMLQVPTEEHLVMAAELPELDSSEDVSTAVSEIFLRKMYSYQR